MSYSLNHLQNASALDYQQVTSPNDWSYATVAEVARQYAKQDPDGVAIYFDNEPNVTHGELDRAADILAQQLQAMGLVKGDVISFQLPNWHEAAIINLAAARLGLIINPIVIIYREREVKYMLENSHSKVLFIAGEYNKFNYIQMIEQIRDDLPKLQTVVGVRAQGQGDVNFAQLLEDTDQESTKQSFKPVCVDIDDIKMLLYTSGTTGTPKGVLHTHRSMYWAVKNSQQHWSVSEQDVMLMASPVTHITGFANGLEFAYYTGGKTAMMERWQSDKAIDYMQQTGASMSLGATPFLRELLDAAQRADTRLPQLRLFACGGADVPPELITEANNSLENCRCFRVYGSSETPIITQGFLQADQLDLAANTDGEIVNYDLQIIDDDGQVLPINEVGEIIAKGPAMMLGYLQAEANLTAFNDQGYFYTGDLGYLTKDNAIVITGRKKDLIIRGGENISAKEIEDILHEHELINEAAAVSMPHQRLGETVCVYLILNKDAQMDFQQLIDHCAIMGLAKQKFPERMEIINEFPRTPSGKIKKDMLRARIKQKVIV